MATRDGARGIGQRRLDAEERPPAETPEPPPTGAPAPTPGTPAAAPEEPRDSGAALRERQRRWWEERDRFEAAADAPPSNG